VFAQNFSSDIITFPVIAFAHMLSAHRISPHALYGYCENYGIHFDTLDRILLDAFLIILEIFLTTNTPAGAYVSVVVKALCYKVEGRWFETRRNATYIFLIYLTFLPH
jgi:hypothetical protein